jgi:hypothetical protein
MRVQFEYTSDDLVDVQLRALRNSAAARAWRWHDLAFTSLLSGVLLFAIIPGEITVRLSVGVIGLILAGLLYPKVNESIVKRRLRKLFQENVGSDKVLICEVELSESGVHTKQNGMEIIYTWENVEEVRETEDSVDIRAEKGGLVVVRKRAFSGSAEQQQFIALATKYLSQRSRPLS